MRAKRSLGQNFLTDDAFIHRIIESVHIVPGEPILEIGPGRGALTGPLLDAGAQVTAVEFDRDMVEVLRVVFGNREELAIVQADALTVDLPSLVPRGSKVVANLPYNISTPILQKLSAEREHFPAFVLMFQREVADRIMAPVSTSDRGFLSVLVQRSFEVERLFDVPPTAFRPPPKVWSSVIRLIPKPRSGVDESDFRTVVSRGFAFRRKTILNNLKGLYHDVSHILESAGIDPSRRAETLSLDDWENLAKSIEQQKAGNSGRAPGL